MTVILVIFGGLHTSASPWSLHNFNFDNPSFCLRQDLLKLKPKIKEYLQYDPRFMFLATLRREKVYFYKPL